MKDFYIGKGDTLPVLVVEVTGIDTLEDVASVVFEFWNKTSGSEKQSGNASVVGDGTSCQVQYEWAEGDTDEVGDYQGEFILTFTDDKVLTAPNSRKIEFSVTRSR
jgi:uncharacterized membrane protein YgcG